MKFFEWLKNLFTRKNKHLLLNAGNEEIKKQIRDITEQDSNNRFNNENNTGNEIEEVQSVDAMIEKTPTKELSKENVEVENELTEEEKKKQRLDSPYFSYKFTVLDGIANRQFQGVDLSTGEILRLENTDKIAETANGMCIYEGYVEHINDEKDISIFDKEKPEGYPVIFESALKLEDVASNKNPEQIKSVLNLLSKNKDVNLLKDQLIYIGGIRPDGKVYRQDCSSEQAAETITQKMIQYRWS